MKAKKTLKDRLAEIQRAADAQPKGKAQPKPKRTTVQKAYRDNRI